MYRFTRIAICEYNKPQSDTVHNPVIRQGGRHGAAAAAAAVAAAAVAAAAVAGAGPTPASQIRHLAGWPPIFNPRASNVFFVHVDASPAIPVQCHYSNSRRHPCSDLAEICYYSNAFAAIWPNSVTTVMRLQRFG